MLECLAKFWECETGATAVEYSLYVGLIALATIFGFRELGESVKNLFEVSRNEVVTATELSLGT